MMNYIWLFMIVAGGVACLVQGGPNFLTQVSIDSAKEAVTFAIGISSSIAFWSGIMKIAEKAGILQAFGKILRPVASFLFPELPKNSEALSSISMSIGANFIGMGNAATPLGLEAMKQLQKVNRDSKTASYSMCTFLMITTSGLTLVPTSIISIRAQLGASNPNDIIGTTFIATLCATVVAIIVDKTVRYFSTRRRKRIGGDVF